MLPWRELGLLAQSRLEAEENGGAGLDRLGSGGGEKRRSVEADVFGKDHRRLPVGEVCAGFGLHHDSGECRAKLKSEAGEVG